MEPEVRPSHLRKYLFHVPFYPVRVKMFSEFVCKYETMFILPKVSGFQSLFCLVFFVFFQNGNDRAGEGDNSFFIVLQCFKIEFF